MIELLNKVCTSPSLEEIPSGKVQVNTERAGTEYPALPKLIREEKKIVKTNCGR